MQNPGLSLVIPLWNEEKNIDQLVSMLVQSPLRTHGLEEVVLVNNGSADRTGQLIEEYAQKYAWIKPLHLAQNQNYGGGVYQGLTHCQTDFLAYIPGDLQVSADDLDKVWLAFKNFMTTTHQAHALFKGRRTVRHDGLNTRLVSKIYTLLANLLLGVRIKDVNGLPKIFHKDLLKSLPAEKMKNFVFDIQLIYTARRKNWSIQEVPVAFHARRQGVSSWSGKRLKTYFETLKQMLRLKQLEYPV